jgi:hypothetical protein
VTTAGFWGLSKLGPTTKAENLTNEMGPADAHFAQRLLHAHQRSPNLRGYSRFTLRPIDAANAKRSQRNPTGRLQGHAITSARLPPVYPNELPSRVYCTLPNPSYALLTDSLVPNSNPKLGQSFDILLRLEST